MGNSQAVNSWMFRALTPTAALWKAQRSVIYLFVWKPITQLVPVALFFRFGCVQMTPLLGVASSCPHRIPIPTFRPKNSISWEQTSVRPDALREIGELW